MCQHPLLLVTLKTTGDMTLVSYGTIPGCYDGFMDLGTTAYVLWDPSEVQ